MQSGYVGTRIGARPTGTEAHIGDCISTAPLAAPFPSPPRFGGFACGTFRSAKDQRPATTCSSPPSARLSIRHRRFEPGAGNRLALGAEAWTPQQEVKCVGWGTRRTTIRESVPRWTETISGDWAKPVPMPASPCKTHRVRERHGRETILALGLATSGSEGSRNFQPP